MGHPIYHLELAVERCAVRVRINDIPVLSLASVSDVPSSSAPPINLYLVGDLNLLDVEILPVPLEGTDRLSSFGDATIRGGIIQYEKGDIVTPTSGTLITEIAIPDELRERVREQELELPQTFTIIFANEVLDFSDELGNATPIADREAILDYGLHLRDLVAARDVPGLLAEMQPKIHAFAVAYDEPEDRMAGGLEDYLGRELLPALPITDFGRDQLDAFPRAGGRIWEIVRAPALPLIQTEPNEEGATRQIPIVVSMRDGHLRVVR